MYNTLPLYHPTTSLSNPFHLFVWLLHVYTMPSSTTLRPGPRLKLHPRATTVRFLEILSLFPLYTPPLSLVHFLSFTFSFARRLFYAEKHQLFLSPWNKATKKNI